MPCLENKLLECPPSKRIHVGVIGLHDTTPETPELVAERIRNALKIIPAERMVVAPDCDMKYLSRDIAFAKRQAMARGANIVRNELGLN